MIGRRHGIGHEELRLSGHIGRTAVWLSAAYELEGERERAIHPRPFVL